MATRPSSRANTQTVTETVYEEYTPRDELPVGVTLVLRFIETSPFPPVVGTSRSSMTEVAVAQRFRDIPRSPFSPCASTVREVRTT